MVTASKEDQNSHWSVKKKYRKCSIFFKKSFVHKPQEEMNSVEP